MGAHMVTHKAKIGDKVELFGKDYTVEAVQDGQFYPLVLVAVRGKAILNVTKENVEFVKWIGHGSN